MRALNLIWKAPLAALLLWCGAAVSPAQAVSPEAAPRRAFFNDGWKFHRGDAPDARRPEFNDASWAAVTLPHDWSVAGPFSEAWGSCTGYLPGGIGWYRKAFTLPAEMTGKVVRIEFDGVYKNSEVWCNGRLLGKRPNGYISFHYDLTPLLRFGGAPNVLAVRVDHSDFADSRWYTGSGIYRNVFLTVTDRVHVAPWGVYLTTPRVTAASAAVAIETTVENAAPAGVAATLMTTVRDARGAAVAKAESALPLKAGGQAVARQSVTIERPTLWSLEAPVLYDVQTQVLAGGKVLDEVHTPLGIRSFRFDADKGFFLNGKGLKLKGGCFHHDAGALGAAVPARVWERRLRLLREMGCNAIRTSHNPPAPELLDLCDRMGFLVMDEAFDEWTKGKKKWTNGVNQGKFTTDGYNRDFAQWAETDLRDMILRDRNHPSIILWSIGNEIDYPNDPFPRNAPELAGIAGRLIKVIKGLDTTRPVTAACAAVPTNRFQGLLDVVGYNYQENLYAEDHRKNPERVIYGSENSHRPEAWQAVRDNDYISAQFLWTGIDFLGEARGWPNRGSQAGLLDLAGFKKSRYYWRQSLWRDTPLVHLEARGERVVCVTNCERVELFQDGKSLGEREPTGGIILWPVPFSGETLRAVGKKGGAAVCSFELRKAGPARRLAVAADAPALAADGRDLAHLEVSVVDAQGNLVCEGETPVTCTVSGPGRLLGMENGNQLSHEPYQGNRRNTYAGRLLIYVQSLKSPGEITVKLAAPGLEGASVKLTAEAR